jgi:hypothetical protein
MVMGTAALGEHLKHLNGTARGRGTETAVEVSAKFDSDVRRRPPNPPNMYFWTLFAHTPKVFI